MSPWRILFFISLIVPQISQITQIYDFRICKELRVKEPLWKTEGCEGRVTKKLKSEIKNSFLYAAQSKKM